MNETTKRDAVEQVTLEAEGKALYDRLRPGTKVTVRYATENPRIAFLAGEERGVVYSQWFERYLGLRACFKSYVNIHFRK